MTAKDIIKAALPSPARHWLRRQPLRFRRWICGDVFLYRRTTPVDVHWGGKRGTIIDRYYIEGFLAQHSADVCGHVLEFANDAYTRKFGGAVTKIDVLDLGIENPDASIIADLNHADGIPSDTFDCIVCTQVLLLIYDLRAAIRTLYRILKPGGVLLLTAPGIQKISRGDMEIGGDYWRFTTLSMQRLFQEVFPVAGLRIEAFGNVLTAAGFLHGLAVEDLDRSALQYQDPDFPVSITVRAVKPFHDPHRGLP